LNNKITEDHGQNQLLKFNIKINVIRRMMKSDNWFINMVFESGQSLQKKCKENSESKVAVENNVGKGNDNFSKIKIFKDGIII